MNRAGKNLAAQVFYQLVTVLTPLITSPYLSRVLGPMQLGIFSSTYSYVCYFMLLCKLGVETYGCREIAKVSDDPVKSSGKFFEIFRIQFLASVLALGVYYLFLAAGQERVNNGAIMAIQGLWIVSALVDINWLLFGLEEFVITTIRNIAIKVITIVLVFCLVKSPRDLDKYILVMAGGQIVSQIVVWPYALKRVGIRHGDFRSSLQHIKPMLYFFVPVMAMSVFHIMDKTMLGIMSTDEQSGFYYNVDRLGNIAIGVSLGINTVMLPRITNSIAGGDRNVSRTLEHSYELVVSSSIAISVGLAAVGPLFVPVFFGNAFLPCVELIDIFAVALVCKSISSCICNQCLVPMGAEKYYVRAVVIGAFVNLVSNYFLIKAYAAKGATIGTVIAEAVVLAISLRRSSGKTNLKKLGADFLKYMAIGAVMFAAVRAAIRVLPESWIGLIAAIALGGIVFIVGTLVNSRADESSVYAHILGKWRH